MVNRVIASVLLGSAALATAGSAAAQQRSEPLEADSATHTAATQREEPVRPPLRPLRIAKWSTLGAALTAAGYGFSIHRDANEVHGRLEDICTNEPARCSGRTADGGYADEELQNMHRDVDRLDDRAMLALAGSQVALAGSIVLFILDLRESAAPPNVIYDPSGLQVRPRDGGAEIGLRIPVGRR